MNKKLIKSILSVACGLGISTSIPFLSTSCGSNSSSSKNFCKLTLVGGTSAALTKKGNFVDYAINQPISARSHDRSANWVEIGPNSLKFYDIESGHTEEECWNAIYEKNTDNWFKYIASDDNGKGMWHLYIECKTEMTFSFSMQFRVLGGTQEMIGGVMHDSTIVSDICDLRFFPEHPQNPVKEIGDLENITYTINKNNYSQFTPEWIANDLNSKWTDVNDSAISTWFNDNIESFPGKPTTLDWSNFIDTFVDSQNESINKIRANFLGFLEVLEVANFINEINNPEKYGRDPGLYYLTDWTYGTDTVSQSIWLPEDKKTDDMKLSKDDLSNISVTVRIDSIIANNSNVSHYNYNPIITNVSNIVMLNGKQIQGVVYNPVASQQTSGLNRALSTSWVWSDDEGLEIRPKNATKVYSEYDYGHEITVDDYNDDFAFDLQNNYESDIFDTPDSESELDGTFNFLGFGGGNGTYKNQKYIVELLKAIFPNASQFNIYMEYYDPSWNMNRVCVTC